MTVARILTIGVWSLCVLGVGGAVALSWHGLGVSNSAIQEIDFMVMGLSLMVATYVTARAVTGIIRAFAPREKT